MNVRRRLVTAAKSAMPPVRSRCLDHMIDVRLAGCAYAGTDPVAGVDLFLEAADQGRNQQLQPLAFLGTSQDDGSFDVPFSYLWAEYQAWPSWLAPSRDSSFGVHFVHDDYLVHVRRFDPREASTSTGLDVQGSPSLAVNLSVALQPHNLSDVQKQHWLDAGGRATYMKKENPDPEGGGWEPGDPWPVEPPIGGETFTLEGDCNGLRSTIHDGIVWAYWRLRNGEIVTDPGLRVCIMDRMNNAEVDCEGGCPSDVNGYNENFLWWDSSTIHLCVGAVQKFGPVEIGKLAIHEWAHSCGWNHGDGKGVPGNSGKGLD